MKERTKLVTMAILLLTLALPIASRAGTIYSNLGTGSSYSFTGYAINSSQQVAMAFTVPAGPGFFLTEVDTAVNYAGEGTNSAFVQLRGDSTGAPGVIIHTWALAGPLPDIGLVTTIQSSQIVSGISGITLSGGTQYWLVALPGDSSTSAGWNSTVPDSTGITNASFDGGATWTAACSDCGRSAFAVFGDPVSTNGAPEPGTMLLLGTGLLGLLRSVRRRA
jgi:PEP-CTERM motif-containing protein